MRPWEVEGGCGMERSSSIPLILVPETIQPFPQKPRGPRDRPLFTAWRYSRECEDSLALRPREPL